MRSAERAFFKLSFAARLVIIGTTLWVLIVPAFVFLFEPYGSYMASDDYLHMLKVMLFPVAVIAAGYFAYNRFVIGDSAKPAEDQLVSANHDAMHRESIPANTQRFEPSVLSASGSSADSEEELLRRYGITRVEGQYVYGTYRFDQIKHAIAHARHVESLRQRL
ncbi:MULTISPECIES: hypothetical protein [Lysobacter]|uniref:hypothetical protein n=1 Tax=Lysobacter TaxID=68 RepID=UPI001F288CCE|nr:MULTISPECIES: hypothetical protein [Lysobacter]UJB19582.1 hypothetical protein L1A79_00330 [Lysobacter capsici]UJQ26692.1 hypothetical protein L2D09_14530 [Lysobacter gummosus]